MTNRRLERGHRHYWTKFYGIELGIDLGEAFENQPDDEHFIDDELAFVEHLFGDLPKGLAIEFYGNYVVGDVRAALYMEDSWCSTYSGTFESLDKQKTAQAASNLDWAGAVAMVREVLGAEAIPSGSETPAWHEVSCYG